MKAEWRKYCEDKGISVQDGEVKVHFANGRSQRVTVEERDDAITMRSVAAGAAVVRELANPTLTAWQRNRISVLVAFRIDEKGRLLGEAVVPKIGLTAQEFQMVLRHLAAEADRLEFQLSGRDRE